MTARLRMYRRCRPDALVAFGSNRPNSKGLEKPHYLFAAPVGELRSWLPAITGFEIERSQYVLQNTGTGTGSIQYFDDSGTLVAIRKYADTPSYCRDTSFDRWYGPVLDCELEPGEDFCDEGQ